MQLKRFRYAPESFERVAYTGDLHRGALWSPLAALAFPSFLFAFRHAIRAEIHEFVPDVIHAHWWLPGGWLVAGRGRPYIVTCHGSDVRLLERSALFRRMARPVFRGAGRVTTVSRFLAADIAKLMGDDTGTLISLPMPVDVTHFQQGLAVLASYASQHVSWSATNRLRGDLLLHCLRLDMAFHKQRTPGELIERIDGDVTELAVFFSQIVVTVFGNGLLLVGVLAALFREDWRAGVGLTLFAALAISIMLRVRHIGVPRWIASRQKNAEAFGFLGEVLPNRIVTSRISLGDACPMPRNGGHQYHPMKQARNSIFCCPLDSLLADEFCCREFGTLTVLDG